MPEQDKYIIRTSDRGMFKKCRTLWDFTSKIRMDYEPVTISWHLEFGTAIHAGLEAFYDPKVAEWPLETRMAHAITNFNSKNDEQLYNRGENPPHEIIEDYDARQELGQGMIRFYCEEYAPQHDKFKVLSVEQEFEVPVLVPQWVPSTATFDVPGFDFRRYNKSESYRELLYNDKPVVYQGRIDMILEDEDGEVWIEDHKTAGAFKESMFHLDVDTQVTSYAWAAQFFLDRPIAGVIYNQIKKSFPQEPELVYKGTKLSKDKTQSTTYDFYVRAIERHGFKEEDYEDFLDYLWKEGPQFVRRFQLHRSQKELDSQGTIIYSEALDMLGNPNIYPNPTEMNCNSCSFQGPCLSRLDGSDWQYILSDPTLYRKRG